MTGSTTDQGLVVPVSTDVNDVVTHMASVLGASGLTSGQSGVESRLVKRYLSATDRTTRNPTPATNELSVRADAPGTYEWYNGSAWVALNQRLMATPVNTSSTGTVTSGTTETRDAVLGNYVFTAVAGRTYRVTIAQLIGNSSVANDQYAIRVRDGGAVTPTAASTLIGETVWLCTTGGTGGRSQIPFQRTFTATSGTHTLAMFAVRLSGTGVFTPCSPAVYVGATDVREMYVEDIT